MIFLKTPNELPKDREDGEEKKDEANTNNKIVGLTQYYNNYIMF